ncbi:hypothetical protein [uncultured Anaerovibrio sp.]|uniref:hypothetical protein n=1 Tax=uncultured Anaerovibrio sp. TaxID=361586 RepID=UPI0025FB3B12|nr:hypothetical protein [uncultured Anaerovibrio sp.]
MPTNVTGMTPSVQATERTQETKGDKLSVKRDGGGSAGSAFSPRTDVSIKNSIDNMAGILSKISSHQSEAENAIPSQLKEIINNIMRSAFSLEGTVGEGVGSSLASQKFSVEQLNTLSRMLHHLGYLSDQGSLGELSEDLQVVFDNIKLAIGKESNIEPVNLNKLAFQLIQNEDNPQAVKQIEELLSQLASLTVSQPGATAAQPSEGFALLNKLVDAFFPKSMFTGGTEQSQTSNSQSANQGNLGIAGNTQGPVMPQENAQPGAAMANGAPQGQTVSPQIFNTNQAFNQGNGLPTNAPGNMANAADNTAPQLVNQGGAGNAATNTVPTAATIGTSTPGTMAQSQGGSGPQILDINQAFTQINEAMGNAQPAGNNAGTPANNTMGNTTPMGNDNIFGKTENTMGSDGAAKLASEPKFANENINVRMNNAGMAYEGTASRQGVADGEINPLFKQIFSRFGQGNNITNNTGNTNSPGGTTTVQMDNQQVANALKDAGQLILKNAELSPKDTELLTNFINKSQGELSQQDAKQLNLLLRTIQSNIPASIQQAGQRMGVDELPKLWAFMQLCDLSQLKKMKGHHYRSASKEINNFVNSMKGSMHSEGSFKADGQKSISFMMPLYLGDGTVQSYPAYVHIYDEPPHEDERGIMRKDTWFRVCVLTESIGAVDVVCRLYEGNNLNLRVIFSDKESVTEFSEYLPDIRKALYDTPINLTDLKIGTVNNAQ